jgi:hypothetical protein
MKKLTSARAALVLALLLAMTGCAASSAPIGSRGVQGVHSATASPPATAAPFAFSCAQSLTAADLAALGPSLAPASELFNVLPPMPSETVAERIAGPIDELLAAVDQGYFDCTWSNAATGRIVRLSVLPDATTAFNAHQASMTNHYTLQSFAAVNLGTAAYGGCGPDTLGQDDRPICELNVLSGSMWLSISLWAPGGYSANVQQNLTSAAGSALSAVAKVGPLPNPVAIPPSEVWTADCAAFGGILPPSSPSATSGSNGTEMYLIDDAMNDPLLVAAILRSDASYCQTSAASIAVFPGNGDITPISYPDGGPTPGASLTIPGMRNARSVCNPAAGAGCWIEGSIGGAYVVANGAGATDLLNQLIAARAQ